MNTLDRWRLILGRYAEQRLPLGGKGGGGQGQSGRMDRALEYLYGREYQGRGLRKDQPHGSLSGSQPTLVTWLSEVRELFPKETVEVIEKHALDRYGMTELITDPQTLERLEPSQELLRTLLALRGHLKGEVLTLARRIIRRVVEDLRRRLESEVRRVLSGRINRFRHSPLAVAQNFDPLGTLRKNLKHFDRERGQLVIEQLRFFERNTRRLRWDIILCVDQSGSMADSVIHSAVMAGILAALPAFSHSRSSSLTPTSWICPTTSMTPWRHSCGSSSAVARISGRPCAIALSWSRTHTARCWCWLRTSAKGRRRVS